MKPAIRVLLDQEAFRKLVAGDVAEVQGRNAEGETTVLIALQDIGFNVMVQEIEKAMRARAR